MGVPSDGSSKLKAEVSTGGRNLRFIDDLRKSHLSRVVVAGQSADWIVGRYLGKERQWRQSAFERRSRDGGDVRWESGRG